MPSSGIFGGGQDASGSGDGTVDWANVQNKPATYTPSVHNHSGVYEPADLSIQTHISSSHAPANAQKNSDVTQAEIEAKLVGEVTSHTHPAATVEAFPVGAVFISVVNTDPSTLLGYGVWSAFGSGRVLVGLDSGQTEFDTLEETGGAKTATLTVTEMPSHTHVQDAHTHSQDPHNHIQNSHTHTQNSFAPRIINSGTAGTVGVQGASAASNANASNAATTAVNQAATATNQAATAINQPATAVNQNTGGGVAFSIMDPYIVVRFWKRTA